MKKPLNTTYLAWIIPSVMILIASIQLYHSHTTNFSKWRGGGFGMYSEISWQNREVWFRDVPKKSNYVETYSEKLNLVCPILK